MPQLTVYTDPSKAADLSLVAELMELPSTPEHTPAENQLTAVLGWPADHSDAFARSVATKHVS
jgi:hypothetical protein